MVWFYFLLASIIIIYEKNKKICPTTKEVAHFYLNQVEQASWSTIYSQQTAIKHSICKKLNPDNPDKP